MMWFKHNALGVVALLVGNVLLLLSRQLTGISDFMIGFLEGCGATLALMGCSLMVYRLMKNRNTAIK